MVSVRKASEPKRGRGGKTLLRSPAGGEVDALAFSPDGALLAAVDWRSNLVLWTPWNAEPRVVQRGTLRKTGVAWAAGGARLLTLEWRSLALWDTAAMLRGEPGALATVALGEDTAVTRMRVSRDGRWCAVRCPERGTGPTELRVYEVGERTLAQRYALAMDSYTTGFAFAPDGRLWIARKRGLQAYALGGAAPEATGAELAMSMPLALAIAPDGASFVASVYDEALGRGVIELRASADGALRARWSDAVTYCQSDALGFAPDGRAVVVAGGAVGSSDARAIAMYDSASGARMGFATSFKATIGAVALAPDGGTLAAACWDGAVRLWDVREYTSG